MPLIQDHSKKDKKAEAEKAKYEEVTRLVATQTQITAQSMPIDQITSGSILFLSPNVT